MAGMFLPSLNFRNIRTLSYRCCFCLFVDVQDLERVVVKSCRWNNTITCQMWACRWDNCNGELQTPIGSGWHHQTSFCWYTFWDAKWNEEVMGPSNIDWSWKYWVLTIDTKFKIHCAVQCRTKPSTWRPTTSNFSSDFDQLGPDLTAEISMHSVVSKDMMVSVHAIWWKKIAATWRIIRNKTPEPCQGYIQTSSTKQMVLNYAAF